MRLVEYISQMRKMNKKALASSQVPLETSDIYGCNTDGPGDTTYADDDFPVSDQRFYAVNQTSKECQIAELDGEYCGPQESRIDQKEPFVRINFCSNVHMLGKKVVRLNLVVITSLTQVEFPNISVT